MSRRSKKGRRGPVAEDQARGGERAEGGGRGGGRAARGAWQPGGEGPGRPPNKLSFAAQVGILVAVFAATVGLAELAGAANLGVSFGIAQIVFAIVLVGFLLRA